MQVMNWDDLRFALAVGRSGTLAAAARSLGVDATTVGRRIAAIEADLGARLFDRLAAGYLPTDAGHRALEQAAEVERATIALRQQVEGRDERVEGPVRLTGLDGIFDRLIIPRLPSLLSRHPGLEVTFASNLGFLDLSRHEADIALRSREPEHPDSVGRRLGRMAQAAYAATTLEVGEAPPLILLSREYDGSGFTRSFRNRFPHGRVVARGNCESHMIALTRAGVGIGVLDCFVGDSDPGLRRVQSEPVATQDLWAEVHVAMARSPRIRAVIDFLGEIFREAAALLAGQRPP